MQRIISDLYIITDEKAVSDKIYELTKIIPDMNKVAAHIQEETYTKYFFDKDLNMISENEGEAYIVWLESGIRTQRNEPVMISLINRGESFQGYFVGTPGYLVNGMCSRRPQMERKLKANQLKFCKMYNKQHPADMSEDLNESIAEKSEGAKMRINKSEEEISNVAETIYDNLLFPHWQSINGLDRYVKIIGTRISQLIEQDKTQYFVKNKINSVIINSGMMNLFGKDFLILYKYYVKYQCYFADSVIQSKEDYLHNGFSKEQTSVELEPICFFDEDADIFNPDLDEFDINQRCLIHIIQERRDRFPESIKEESDSKIAFQMINALERGIKMQHRDHSFVKASYSGKTGSISWFLPLHIDTSLDKEPELVMVIRKTDDFYEVKTILPYNDDIRDRITALSLYRKVW